MSEEKTENKGLTPAEKEEADIRANELDENSDGDFEALFDEEVSEESLKGEEAEGEEEKPTEEKPTDEKSETEKPATSESKGDEKKIEEKPDEKKVEAKETEEKPEEVDYTKPPPRGYVPLPAVQEERAINKGLKDQINTLQKTVELLQNQTAKKEIIPEDDEFKDFKVLSSQEFKELVEDDSDEALIYQNKLERYNERQHNLQNQQQIELSQKRKIESAINQSIEKIHQSVPGLYDEGNPLAAELFDFAVSNGFNSDYLTLLTTPATRVIPIDADGNVSNQSLPLAEGAASMITMLYKLYQSTKDNNPENLRSQIEAEVKEKLRKEITEELLEKFKSETTGQSFRSITDVPGGSDEEPTHKKIYSEADFAKMSEKDQQRILSGA